MVVFNSLGFARRGLVELQGSDSARPANPVGPEQASAEGGRLFVARLPSLGYATEDLARRGSATIDRTSLALQPDGTAAILANDFLRATLRQDAGWGITSLVDEHSGAELIAAGQVGNALVPYSDDGGLYRFGSEMQGCGLDPLSGEGAGAALTVLRADRCRVRVVADRRRRTGFQKEYQLVAGEPFVRMISTGSAAPGTSVMALPWRDRSTISCTDGVPLGSEAAGEPGRSRSRPRTISSYRSSAACRARRFFMPAYRPGPFVAMDCWSVPSGGTRTRSNATSKVPTGPIRTRSPCPMPSACRPV